MYSSTVIFQPLSAVLSFSAGVNCCIPVLLISSPTQLFWDYQQGINILFQYLLVFSSPCKLFCLFCFPAGGNCYFLAQLFSSLSRLIGVFLLKLTVIFHKNWIMYIRTQAWSQETFLGNLGNKTIMFLIAQINTKKFNCLFKTMICNVI